MTIRAFFYYRILFPIHIGINQNPSKSSKLISFIWLINWFPLILASHSSSSSLPSYTLPVIGMSIGERLRDRGFDTTISFDDSPKHSKSYRQISSIPAKIPSRDASPSDIPNIHASISERRGKLKICYFSGSISASPIIETIANDTTEYTATNIIPFLRLLWKGEYSGKCFELRGQGHLSMLLQSILL